MDIQKLVNDLLGTGLSQTELAKLAGCAPHTITRYANGDRGKRPSYEIASKLQSLHRSRCKKKPRNEFAEPANGPP